MLLQEKSSTPELGRKFHQLSLSLIPTFFTSFHLSGTGNQTHIVLHPMVHLSHYLVFIRYHKLNMSKSRPPPHLSQWWLHLSMSSGQQPWSPPISSITPISHTWSIWSTENPVNSAFKIYPLLFTPSQVAPCRSTPPSLFLVCIISISLSHSCPHTVYSQMKLLKHRWHHPASLFRTLQCLFISE